MQEVYKNVFMFPVSLPNSPLREINIYIVKGKDRSIVIDTGFNKPESKKDLLEGIKSLGLELKDLDLVLTHLHSDHAGLASMFAEAGCKIYTSRIDGDILNHTIQDAYWEYFLTFRKLYGMDEDEVDVIDHAGYAFKPEKQIEFIELNPGDTLKVGDYKFDILDLKGHTPGHIGLYEKDHKILFGGDTVLDPITPNITDWGKEYDDILGTYLVTLRTLLSMDLKYIFPSHRQIIVDHKNRVEQLISHHYLRMQEILDAMDFNKEYTVKEVSAHISWRIKAKGWENFPKAQKWFATGETMSHMEHLVKQKFLSMREDDGVYKFTKLKERVK
ncbi:MAG: MBL fold metallo-hydrolase, partial [Tissierellia bacterium]|nr:MBL fold metallo-hydrolase [Tissierellia bacterium]